MAYSLAKRGKRKKGKMGKKGRIKYLDLDKD
jgi:hypothetical protein